MFKHLRGLFLGGLLSLLLPGVAAAQISGLNVFSPNTRILSADVNFNFTKLANEAVKRDGSGAITGNISVNNGVTIDGVDLSAWLNQSVQTTASPTFANVTAGGGNFTSIGTTSGALIGTVLEIAGTAANALDVAGGIEVGSGNVQLVATDGRINGPLSATILNNLDGTALTGLAKLASNNAFTARNDFHSYTEKVVTPAISSGTLTLDLSTATHFAVALNANITTFTISNVPNPGGTVSAFTVRFLADGTPRTITWGASVVWPSGTAPTMSSTNGRADFITFITYNGGTTWYGFVGGQNFF
jgi:hypothetical protein